MIITLNIPNIDWANDAIITFISGFRDTILKGLKVLNNLSILRSIFPKLMSIIAVTTMKKSSWHHESLRYAFFPIINPFEIILRRH